MPFSDIIPFVNLVLIAFGFLWAGAVLKINLKEMMDVTKELRIKIEDHERRLTRVETICGMRHDG